MNNPISLERKDWVLGASTGILIGAVGVAAVILGWPSEIRILLVLVIFATVSTWGVLLLYRRLQTEIRLEANHLEAAIAVNAMIKARLPLPAFGGAAIEADTARELISLILQKRPRRVMECGSGLSTLLVGYVLERLGDGEVLSMEHLADWADLTRNRIEQHGLQHHARVFHAPLEWVDLGGMATWKWYARRCWEDWKDVDLLIVDGPPAWEDRFARHPALPLLWDHLNDGAVILLDDTARPGEKGVVTDWIALYPGRLIRTHVGASRGLTLLTVSKK